MRQDEGGRIDSVFRHHPGSYRHNQSETSEAVYAEQRQGGKGAENVDHPTSEGDQEPGPAPLVSILAFLARRWPVVTETPGRGDGCHGDAGWRQL